MKPVHMQPMWEEVNSSGKYTHTQINTPCACDFSIPIFRYKQCEVLEKDIHFFLALGIKFKECSAVTIFKGCELLIRTDYCTLGHQGQSLC